jgi:hypothetical protein
MKKKMYTTLADIQSLSPPDHIWQKLLRFIGKTKADKSKFFVGLALKQMGLRPALYVLETIKGFDNVKRLFICQCAKNAVQRLKWLTGDTKGLCQVIEVAERLIQGASVSGAEIKKAFDMARRVKESVESEYGHSGPSSRASKENVIASAVYLTAHAALCTLVKDVGSVTYSAWQAAWDVNNYYKRIAPLSSLGLLQRNRCRYNEAKKWKEELMELFSFEGKYKEVA